MTQQDQRVSYSEALARLEQFRHLSIVIDGKWLERQMKKPVVQYNLITGWLTTSPDYWNSAFLKNTQALENALVLLIGNVSDNIWKKLCSKLRARSNRAESKGVIAELSLAVFLVDHGLPFDMEIELNPPTDVDFVVTHSSREPVYIEVQSLAESNASHNLSAVSAAHEGLVYGIDFKTEERRIIGKLHDKTKKLVLQSISLVALDCTQIPEHSNTIRDALTAVFNKRGTTSHGIELIITQLVDAVIWFQIDFENALRPKVRCHALNEHSPHNNSPDLLDFIKLWSAQRPISEL